MAKQVLKPEFLPKIRKAMRALYEAELLASQGEDCGMDCQPIKDIIAEQRKNLENMQKHFFPNAQNPVQ